MSDDEIVNPVVEEEVEEVAGQYDIDATLLMIDFVLSGVQVGKLAYSDKKLDFSDLQYLPPLIAAAGPVIGKISEIPSEIGDLDAEEATRLLAHAAQRLPGLVDEELARKVNASLKVVVALAEAYSAFRGVQVSL